MSKTNNEVATVPAVTTSSVEENISVSTTSTYEENTTCTPEEHEAAIKRVRACAIWQAHNPDVINHIVNEYLKSAERGEYIDNSRLLSDARRMYLFDIDGKRSRINNSFAPIINRYLAQLYPQYKHLMAFRTTVYDATDIVAEFERARTEVSHDGN